MKAAPKETIADLLIRNVPRNLVMGIEDGLTAGAQRAYAGAQGMEDGHLPHVVGQLRHFHMNESFYRALASGDAHPTPIRGNGIISGRAGMFTVARFNIPEGFWVNGRRSQTRRQMCIANKSIEPLVQPELFDTYTTPTDAVVFFVACFSGSLKIQPESPVSIQIAVPNRKMTGWLFRQPLSEFLRAYDVQEPVVEDRAVPTLKKDVGKQESDGTAL